MLCAYECYLIGGPFIAENPECPVHGAAAHDSRMKREELLENIQSILVQTWHREISADEAYELIEQMI